jgi:primosomal protein N' (replication factor Y)
MKYYLVAPIVYIGKNSEFLTYHSDKEIEVGTAVKIELRNKQIIGIIFKETEKPTFITKEIGEKYFDSPILTQEMISTANWISNYYLASMPSVLQTIIPSGIDKKRRVIKNIEASEALEKFPKLSEDQEKVFKDITEKGPQKPHLIFGVTGSGKTEVYMNLIKETLDKGKEVIVLVPEVSLTPQALERYQKRFGDNVTVLHSYLKETERFANWKNTLDRKKRIVIGSRSALFAPFKNLGLIVIDEEHENTYKQDRTPKYETAKVAEKLAKETGSYLILGSATPKIETFFRAKTGEIFLHNLSKRFIQDKFPETEIIDMRHELKMKNFSIFSEKLKEEINKTLESKKQVILFLNRRGMSTFVSCRDCGFVEKCPNCDTSLTFHFNSLDLTCHHCGYNKKPSILCPKCNSSAIKYFGTGTEKVEVEIKKFFGDKYSVGRMDADTTKIRGSHEELYNNFAQNRVDILVGTQMISKGWDLPNVGLVGIITADTMINFPDYTSAERTFNLLTQVGGRTGRGQENGKVIIQTYNPDYPAIVAAAQHDYPKFYSTEIQNREDLDYPPFATLIKIVYNNVVQNKAKTATESKKKEIQKLAEEFNFKIIILGPSPAFIPKLNNKYYYQITLKLLTKNEKVITSFTKKLNGILNEEWSIDIDPSDLI